MKPLFEYINEAIDSGVLKKIDKFRKDISKTFDPSQIELQNLGGRFDKYWQIMIHSEITKEDLEKLDGLIKEMLPHWDSKKYNQKVHNVNNLDELVEKINGLLEDKRNIGGKPVSEFSWEYLRFNAKDFKI